MLNTTLDKVGAGAVQDDGGDDLAKYYNIDGRDIDNTPHLLDHQ